jgi:hypothetical protein
MSEFTDEFLSHHGIKGMKWGVRKEESSSGSAGARLRSLLPKKKPNPIDKQIKSMSDDELRRRLNRLQMEKQFKTLSGPDSAKGRALAMSALKVAGKFAVKAVGVAAVYGGAAAIGSKYHLDEAGIAHLDKAMKLIRVICGGK